MLVPHHENTQQAAKLWIPTWSMQATSADILNQGTQCPVTKRTGVAVLILGKIRIKDNRGCVMF